MISLHGVISSPSCGEPSLPKRLKQRQREEKSTHLTSYSDSNHQRSAESADDNCPLRALSMFLKGNVLLPPTPLSCLYNAPIRTLTYFKSCHGELIQMSVQISSIKLTPECDHMITAWDLGRNAITGSDWLCLAAKDPYAQIQLEGTCHLFDCRFVDSESSWYLCMESKRDELFTVRSYRTGLWQKEVTGQGLSILLFICTV